MEKVYDVLILGAGPAGLTAGLYAGRSGLSAGILEQGQDGGQIANTMAVENYPGQCLDGESGTSLAARMAAQAEQFGAARIQDTIQAAELQGQIKRLTGLQGEYLARAVIIATGASPRPIGCKNEAEFVGKGLSYCATCDGPLFRNRAVYVVGGGDAAVEEAVYLAKFAREVTVIHRRDRLRAAKSIQERAFQHPRIRFLWDTVVEAVDGDGVLSAMTVAKYQNRRAAEYCGQPGGRAVRPVRLCGPAAQHRPVPGGAELGKRLSGDRRQDENQSPWGICCRGCAGQVSAPGGYPPPPTGRLPQWRRKSISTDRKIPLASRAFPAYDGKNRRCSP